MIQDYLFKIGDEVFVPMIGDKPAKVHQIESVSRTNTRKRKKVQKITHSYTYASALYSYNPETKMLKVNLYNFSDRFLHHIVDKGDSYILTIDIKHSQNRTSNYRTPNNSSRNSVRTASGKLGHCAKMSHVTKGTWHEGIDEMFPISIEVNKDNYQDSLLLDLSMLVDWDYSPISALDDIRSRTVKDKHFLNIKPVLFKRYHDTYHRACKLRTKMQTIWCNW